MEKIVIYHGSSQIVEMPEIKITKYNKDFYFGFYCTIMEKQAKRWATRFGGEGYISLYEYTPNRELNILIFEKMTEEWLDFIVDCRSGKAFWELAKFKYPTHQISFHTARALATLRFLEGVLVHEE